MAFLMVPPAQITPKMPREQRSVNIGVGNDPNQNTLMLAVIQMLMQRDSDERRFGIEGKLAESSIETQKLQREMVKLGEKERKISEARMRADQAQQARRKEVTEKFTRSQDEIDREIIRERFSGSQESPLGKEVLNLSRKYQRQGNVAEKDIIGALEQLPYRFQKEFNAAGSDTVRFGIASRFQNELANLRAVAGSNADIADQVDVTLESLAPVLLPYVQDEAGVNRYMARSRMERERTFTSDLDARAQAVQDEASRLSEVSDLSPEDFQRKLRGAVTSAYSGLSLPGRVHPRLDIEPGEVRPVTLPATTGAMSLTNVGQKASDVGSWFSEIYGGRKAVSSGPRPWSGAGGSWDDVQTLQAELGLSGHSPANVTPAPVATEEYTEDGWMKAPAAPSSDYDFLWNP